MSKAQEAADKIMLVFDSGGLVPLDLHQYAVIDAHVRSILIRTMESSAGKKQRKWAGFQASIKAKQPVSEGGVR